MATKQPKSSRPHMPDYGIQTSRKGMLPWKWAEQRLKKSRQYWISTVRPDGSPHTMIIWGLWLDGRFLFSTGAKSRKARNLERNPGCVIGTENAEQAVIVEGEVQLSRDPVLRKQFVALYEKKYKWDMTGFEEPMYVMQPRVAFGLYEKKFTGSATRWQFR